MCFLVTHQLLVSFANFILYKLCLTHFVVINCLTTHFDFSPQRLLLLLHFNNVHNGSFILIYYTLHFLVCLTVWEFEGTFASELSSRRRWPGRTLSRSNRNGNGGPQNAKKLHSTRRVLKHRLLQRRSTTGP